MQWDYNRCTVTKVLSDKVPEKIPGQLEALFLPVNFHTYHRVNKTKQLESLNSRRCRSPGKVDSENATVTQRRIEDHQVGISSEITQRARVGSLQAPRGQGEVNAVYVLLASLVFDDCFDYLKR